MNAIVFFFLLLRKDPGTRKLLEDDKENTINSGCLRDQEMFQTRKHSGISLPQTHGK